MGVFNFFKRSSKPATKQPEPTVHPIQVEFNLFDDFDNDEEKQIQTEIKELRAKSIIWEKHFNRMIQNREIAKKHEKEGELQKAIEIYSKSITQCQEGKVLKYNNYAFDIGRLVILVSKAKQTKQLITLLERLLVKYPAEVEAVKWNERLNKLRKQSS